MRKECGRDVYNNSSKVNSTTNTALRDSAPRARTWERAPDVVCWVLTELEEDGADEEDVEEAEGGAAL